MVTPKVIIMGAAGRDFHNFNTYYRDNPAYDVVAFTAAQIPNIDGRSYPRELAGTLYPKSCIIAWGLVRNFVWRRRSRSIFSPSM